MRALFFHYKYTSAKCVISAGKRVSSAMYGKVKAIHGISAIAPVSIQVVDSLRALSGPAIPE